MAAFISLQPTLHQQASGGACAPRPCAAPQGFEARIGDLKRADGLLTMRVTFHNGTQPDAFEAVAYRHTSPADFELRGSDGTSSKPLFRPGCPDWPELRVQRGASAGPEILCFTAPAGGLKGAKLVWSPDLGLLFQDVSIPLG